MTGQKKPSTGWRSFAISDRSTSNRRVNRREHTQQTYTYRGLKHVTREVVRTCMLHALNLGLTFTAEHDMRGMRQTTRMTVVGDRLPLNEFDIWWHMRYAPLTGDDVWVDDGGRS